MRMTGAKTVAAAAVLAGILPGTALAVEGGLGAYLLGSRDTMAGFVPPPGTYVTTDFVFLDGSVANVSIGGLPVIGADVSSSVFKLGITQSFEGDLWGGQPAVNVNIPFAWADLDFTGPFGTGISDSESGMGDIAITPMVGWHSGKLHWNAFASVYVPLGKYDVATVNLAARDIDALSVGKNVWAIQPGMAATWMDPQTGLEFSGAFSLLFSDYNSDTRYQSAPQYTLEGAVVQHLPSGLALGLTGYAYGQTKDDSGEGAAATKTALGARSLKAEVYSLGGLMTYQGELFGQPTTFKAEYTHEFGARRRFESDILWLSATFAF